MAQATCFDKKQRRFVGEALETAEALAQNHFQVDLDDLDRFPYDLLTLVHLQGLEKTPKALAQVCKYAYRKKTSEEKAFYRICLQDDRILQTVQADLATPLKPLLLYVITHEVIHVVRFSLDPQRFHLAPRERDMEERVVHRTTCQVLKGLKDPWMEILLERYRPWCENPAGIQAGRPERKWPGIHT